MAGLVTQKTNQNVDEYIAGISPESKRKDSEWLLQTLREITQEPGHIWGNNFIIGFGSYKYKRKGGKEEFEWFHMGFAPRKTKITLYLTCDLSKEAETLSKLGKCKWGKGCLYINKLADVDLDLLKSLMMKSKDAQWHSN